MKKTVVLFEGFSSSGKTTLIRHLIPYFEPNLEIINKTNPEYLSMLYPQNNETKSFDNIYSKFAFRWARLFLTLKFINTSPKTLFFMDRGILTTYANGVSNGFTDEIQAGFISEAHNMLAQHDYKTVFLDCSLETAKTRIGVRNLKIDKKIKSNESFAPIFAQIKSYDFLGKLLIIDTNQSPLTDLQKIIGFIQNT
jgi:thymidylate kinase